MTGIVVIGGGHAAGQFCASLIQNGYEGRVTFVSGEAFLPYHRPPLSKHFLEPDSTPRYLVDAGLFARPNVELLLGARAMEVDRIGKRVLIESPGNQARALDYDHLVLATGARPRCLSDATSPTGRVFYLQSFPDALRLHGACRSAQKIIIIGGGFIGLEFGALLASTGKSVRIVESSDRLLRRAVSPTISEQLSRLHGSAGIEILFNATVQHIVDSENEAGVVLEDRTLSADMIVVSIGSVPNMDLAHAAGLACGNGVEVDASLCTSDPAISAIGDCTSFLYGPWQQRIRLESVQNATAQAQTLAAVLSGKAERFACRPWFWSDQGSVRFQMTGLWRPACRSEVAEGPTPGAFSVLHYEDGQLAAVESINDMRRHLALRKQMYIP